MRCLGKVIVPILQPRKRAKIGRDPQAFLLETRNEGKTSNPKIFLQISPVGLESILVLIIHGQIF
jgi:hypothetical protein